MDKACVLEKYKNEDEKMLISKLFDKITLMEKQNKVQTTDFLSPIELKLVKDVLNSIGFKNYDIYGGTENAQRNIIIVYPDKLEPVFAENNFDYNSLCNCIRIQNCVEKYDHKVYLGGLIKLGIKREKVGDILVFDDGADIIVSKDISKFLIINLQDLTRFKKCEINLVNINEVRAKEQQYKEMKIIISSLRLDNVVSELANTSRNKATEILKQERVFINYKNEIKPTKIIQEKDIITIRGIGKFVLEEITGNTRSGKVVMMVKKFV
ncbi:MAG: hypothetical protein IKN65_00350 [Clostridia bacterium]|nr:hypothetical protein [Clostridia bacterium]